MSQTLESNVDFCEKVLALHGYLISDRDPNVKPEFEGKYMVIDPLDNDEGYAIVGDDRKELVIEAFDHIFLGVESFEDIYKKFG